MCISRKAGSTGLARPSIILKTGHAMWPKLSGRAKNYYRIGISTLYATATEIRA